MRKSQEVLRLCWGCGVGIRQAARSLAISHSTVLDVLHRAQAAGLSWPLPEVLAEAGYPRGFRVRLLHQTRDLEIVLAQIVDAGWRAVGLDVVLEPMEATATLDRKMSRDFEATVDTVAGIDPNHFFTRLFHSAAAPPAAFNYFGYGAADDLIASARREKDPIRRRAVYERLHRQLMVDLPVVPLSNQVAVAAWRDPVVGMVHGRNNQFWSETIRIKRP